MAEEICAKCRKGIQEAKTRYRCSACAACFCPSCMDRYCLFCKAAVTRTER